MTGQEIIDKILFFKGLNAKSFSEKIGLDRPQAIYDIQKGKTKAISGKLANKIISVFPDFNKIWLLTGEGNMLKTPEQTNSLEYSTSSISLELIQAMIEERKRHDEERKRHDEMNAELIRQNGSLIRMLEERENGLVQNKGDASCADADESGLVG